MSSTCKKCLLGASILHVHVEALLCATSAVSMVTHSAADEAWYWLKRVLRIG